MESPVKHGKTDNPRKLEKKVKKLEKKEKKLEKKEEKLLKKQIALDLKKLETMGKKKSIEAILQRTEQCQPYSSENHLDTRRKESCMTSRQEFDNRRSSDSRRHRHMSTRTAHISEERSPVRSSRNSSERREIMCDEQVEESKKFPMKASRYGYEPDLPTTSFRRRHVSERHVRSSERSPDRSYQGHSAGSIKTKEISDEPKKVPSQKLESDSRRHRHMSTRTAHISEERSPARSSRSSSERQKIKCDEKVEESKKFSMTASRYGYDEADVKLEPGLPTTSLRRRHVSERHVRSSERSPDGSYQGHSSRSIKTKENSEEQKKIPTVNLEPDSRRRHHMSTRNARISEERDPARSSRSSSERSKIKCDEQVEEPKKFPSVKIEPVMPTTSHRIRALSVRHVRSSERSPDRCRQNPLERSMKAKENSKEPKKVPSVKLEPDMPTTSHRCRALSVRYVRSSERSPDPSRQEALVRYNTHEEKAKLEMYISTRSDPLRWGRDSSPEFDIDVPTKSKRCLAFPMNIRQYEPGISLLRRFDSSDTNASLWESSPHSSRQEALVRYNTHEEKAKLEKYISTRCDPLRWGRDSSPEFDIDVPNKLKRCKPYPIKSHQYEPGISLLRRSDSSDTNASLWESSPKSSRQEALKRALKTDDKSEEPKPASKKQRYNTPEENAKLEAYIPTRDYRYMTQEQYNAMVKKQLKNQTYQISHCGLKAYNRIASNFGNGKPFTCEITVDEYSQQRHYRYLLLHSEDPSDIDKARKELDEAIMENLKEEYDHDGKELDAVYSFSEETREAFTRLGHSVVNRITTHISVMIDDCRLEAVGDPLPPLILKGAPWEILYAKKRLDQVIQEELNGRTSSLSNQRQEGKVDKKTNMVFVGTFPSKKK
uniref:Protein kinase domain-containing protein n=1 Tax=Caenorhabditis tropicalis TaxID=1561998 RepID=A0A1I7USG2_9PELO